MIDLHCHLLPSLDDGARDLEDAVAMARQAEADGIEAICATPHIRHDHDVRPEDLPRRRGQVQEALDAAGCTIRVLAGAEVAVTALPDLDEAQLRGLTLGGGGRWILLEPPSGPLDERTERAVASLHQRGLQAVIAHPERHPAGDLVDRLRRLADGHGAIVQGTAAYLLDPATAPGLRVLAEAGVLHVLGSDAHSSRAGRRVELTRAVQALGGVARCAPHLEWIARAAPRAIVAGETIRPPF